MSDELEHEAASADAEASKLYAESAQDFVAAAHFKIEGDEELSGAHYKDAVDERAQGDAEHGQAEEFRHEAEQMNEG